MTQPPQTPKPPAGPAPGSPPAGPRWGSSGPNRRRRLFARVAELAGVAVRDFVAALAVTGPPNYPAPPPPPPNPPAPKPYRDAGVTSC